MSGSIDKEFGKKVEAWKSVFASFIAWSTMMLAKPENERRVSYKPTKGKGSNDPPRDLKFETKHRDAIIAALRLNAFDNGLIETDVLEQLGLWDSRMIETRKGFKPFGKKIGGRPIAEGIGIAKLLGCPVTSLPKWERQTKEKAIPTTIDVDADVVVRMLEEKAAKLAASALNETQNETQKNGKKNGKNG